MKILIEHEVPDGNYCAAKNGKGWVDCSFLIDFEGDSCLLFDHSFYCKRFPYRKLKACRDAGKKE